MVDSSSYALWVRLIARVCELTGERLPRRQEETAFVPEEDTNVIVDGYLFVREGTRFSSNKKRSLGASTLP